jgi:hypothetical protein
MFVGIDIEPCRFVVVVNAVKPIALGRRKRRVTPPMPAPATAPPMPAVLRHKTVAAQLFEAMAARIDDGTRSHAAVDKSLMH